MSRQRYGWRARPGRLGVTPLDPDTRADCDRVRTPLALFRLPPYQGRRAAATLAGDARPASRSRPDARAGTAHRCPVARSTGVRSRQTRRVRAVPLPHAPCTTPSRTLRSAFARPDSGAEAT